MIENYFSDIPCAGGCGNLLPRHMVEQGKRFHWGHKNGCPPEGESPRRKSSTTPKQVPASAGKSMGLNDATKFLNAELDSLGEQIEDRCADLEKATVAIAQLSARYKKTQNAMAALLAIDHTQPATEVA